MDMPSLEIGAEQCNTVPIEKGTETPVGSLLWRQSANVIRGVNVLRKNIGIRHRISNLDR
jgi:hypothetical protein